ncbi:MAG: M15 family metallopeptidase [Clostridia bacterium]|nr:M15 family metallopeptidase [Clostridia bacterium]
MPRKRRPNYIPFITAVCFVVIVIAAIIFAIISALNGGNTPADPTPTTTTAPHSVQISATTAATTTKSTSATTTKATTVAVTTTTKPPKTTATSTSSTSDTKVAAYNNYISKFALAPRSGFVVKSKADINKGLQILVNNDHAYDTTQSSDLINMMNVSNRSYFVAYTDLDADRFTIQQFNYMNTAFLNKYSYKLQACSGYRSYESQKNKFDNSVANSGLEETLKWYTRPGHSEHHTGFAIDYNTNAFGSEKFDGKGDQAFIHQTCHNYGFILRYTAEKKPITGVNAEAWHFRQVGIPHATYIMKNNICLEEYIDKLYNYSYQNPLKVTDDDGHKYEIYYVKSAGESTDVPVTSGAQYTISGNNIDGFIVTVLK